MAVDVKPGSSVVITITKAPTNEAAAKTLSRVFGKDAKARKLRMRRKELRIHGSHPIRRGGRIWMVRPKAPRLVMPEKGDTCTIRATVDVIADLGSVSRFVSIKSK